MIGLMIRSYDFHSPRSFEYTSPILNLQVDQARQWGLLVSLNTLIRYYKKRLKLMRSKCNKSNLHKMFNTNLKQCIRYTCPADKRHYQHDRHADKWCYWHNHCADSQCPSSHHKG